MAGKKGRSGRRPAAEEAGLSEPGTPRLELAELLGSMGTTEVEIVAYLGRVQQAFLRGLCSLAEAKEFRDSATSAARVLGRRADRREIDELRDMLARAEDIERQGQAHAAADRLHRTDGTERTRPADGGDPPPR